MGSSSESEDDCYGNIAQKLQSMKNNYREDKFESTNLLNQSNEIDKVTTANATAKIDDEPANVSLDDSIDALIKSHQSKKEEEEANKFRRQTRSSKKNSANSVTTDQEVTETSPPKRASRGRGNARTTRGRGRGRQSTIEETLLNSPPNRRRGRGRQSVQSTIDEAFNAPSNRRRGRGRRSIPTSFNIYPTYNIGNTDEYPDELESQPLFSAKPNEVVIVDETDPLEENEELSVKVYWQNSEYFRFKIRKYQKLTQIFDFFSGKEGVSTDKLLFTYNDKILKRNDTPDSISYSIAKFIDGGIVNQSLDLTIDEDDGNGIKIKFQCQNVKKPFETTINPHDKLSLAMMKCAEHLEKPLEKLKFEFDGDVISGKSTAQELELEGGECIDVKIMS